MAASSPSAQSAARRENYLKNRKPRACMTDGCENLIDLGSKKRKCDECRSTPDMRCKKCKKVQRPSRFSRDASRPSGFFPWCMECQGSSTPTFQDPDAPLNGKACPLCDTPIRGKANRIYCSRTCGERVGRLRSNYGLSPEQYKALIAANEGRCPICANRSTSWQVDHNHKTGEVLGAVCISCNVGSLAYTHHDIAYIQRLLEFVSNSPARRLGIVALAPKRKASKLHQRWGYGGGRR